MVLRASPELIPGCTGKAVGGRPEPSADLLRQFDEDPLRAADVAEPIAVCVALHLANELRAAGSQAGDDGVDIVDCKCDMADARGVRRRVSTQPPSTGPLALQLESELDEERRRGREVVDHDECACSIGSWLGYRVYGGRSVRRLFLHGSAARARAA